MTSGSHNCAQCAELLNKLERANDQLVAEREEKQGLATLLGRKQAEVERLKTERRRQEEEDPEWQLVKRVGDAWRAECGHPRAKFPADGLRAGKVRARLRERFSVEDLLKAVRGASRFPYVVNGRRAPHGPAEARHDDLELICRSEKHVETFIALADRRLEPAKTSGRALSREQAVERACVSHGRDFGDPSRPRLYPRAFETFVAELHRAGCQIRENPMDRSRLMAQCPAHDDRDPSLSVREAENGSLLIHCFAGCETHDVLKAVGLTWGSFGFESRDALTSTAEARRQHERSLFDQGEAA